MNVVIASRMSSSRLPGKALKKIYGNLSMLDILLKRLSSSRLINKIILATSTDKSDDPLEVWAKKNNIYIFRGSLDDVLGRLENCLKEFQLEDFVEILGDNPFVDPNDIDQCIKTFNSDRYDYVATSTTEYEFSDPSVSYPIGVRVQCLKSALIYKASSENLDEYSREHSSSFIYKKNDSYNVKLIKYKGRRFENLEKVNLAVNTEDDFERNKIILDALGTDASLEEILDFAHINKLV